jgi:hypothetical protein
MSNESFPDLAPFFDVAAVLANADEHPEFCPPPTLMQQYARALLASVGPTEKIQARKTERMAQADIRSGWRARNESPYKWWQ